MSERLAFVQQCPSRRQSIVVICARFGISEKTGHKILARFREGGPAALADRSHAAPPAASLAAQQARFAHVQGEYNTERPHESVVDRRPPASVYTPSLRAYPRRLPTLSDPATALVRRVAGDGSIKVHGTRLFLSTALAGEEVGLTQQQDAMLTIAYGQLALGEFDLTVGRVTPCVRWTGP
jgi:hypothetical protein